MFSKRKRLVAMLAAVVLPLLAALWSAVLSKLTTTSVSGPQTFLRASLPYAYVAVICLVSVAAAYLTHLKPAKDLEKPLLRLLDLLAENPLRLGNKYNIGPRMNLMVVERPWYFVGRKRIRVAWGANRNSFPDVRLKCFCDQGVSGQAFSKRVPVLADCSVADKGHFKFSQKQLEDTAHVKVVWSWPIYQIDSKGQQTGKIVGIVNLDGTKDGAFERITTNAGAFEKSMRRFTEVASTIV